MATIRILHHLSSAKYSDFLKRNRARLGIYTVVATVILGLIISLPARAAISYRSATTANNGAGASSLDLSTPAGVQADDVLIAVVGVRGGAGTTITTPSGWSLINSTNYNSNLLSSIYYRIASGSEPSSTSFAFSSSEKASGVMAAYTGVDTSSPINAQDVQSNASSSTLTTPSVTTTTNDTMLVAAYGFARNTTLTEGSGMTLRGQDSSTGGGGTTRTTSGLQDVIQSSAGSTGSKSMTASNSTVNIGHIIALKPANSIVTQASYRLFSNEDSTGGGTGWWNSAWTQRRKITLDNSASTENLTNFPIRVSLSSSNIDYSKTQNLVRISAS